MSAHCNACGVDLSYTDDGGLVCIYCEMQAERDALRKRVAELEHPSGVLEGESLAVAYARMFRERDALRKELDEARSCFVDELEVARIRAQLDEAVGHLRAVCDTPASWEVDRPDLDALYNGRWEAAAAFLSRYQENQP